MTDGPWHAWRRVTQHTSYSLKALDVVCIRSGRCAKDRNWRGELNFKAFWFDGNLW